MECPLCNGPTRRFGRNRNRSQRYRCDSCRRTFTDEATRPRDGRRLPEDKEIMALRHLLEGNSVRSTERLLEIHRDTILDAMVRVGEDCQRFLEGLRHLPAEDVQIDELWAFVRCKEKTRQRLGYGEEVGDVWTFLAIERTNKMILAFHVGKRTPEDALEFVEKLRRATRPARFQLSSDGFTPYPGAVSEVFGPNIDFGQVVKVFGPTAEQGTAGRYSPGQVISVEKWATIGRPDEERICTSHVERQNKTLRMQIRRFTRLTDGHSKKWANHEAATALFLAYFNYCRIHSTLKVTPAMAAGLTDHVWSVRELLSTAARS
jgi:transposase-like protein/IS1 family transposase